MAMGSLKGFSFKDFILKGSGEEASSFSKKKQSLEQNITNIISPVLASQTPIKSSVGQSKDVARSITSFVFSEEFVDEISEVIGTPKEGESKEAFIARCKESTRKVLSNKFKKK